MFLSQNYKYDCKYKYYYAEIFQVISKQVHAQYISGCKSISMYGVSIDHFKKLNTSIVLMAIFFSSKLPLS